MTDTSESLENDQAQTQITSENANVDGVEANRQDTFDEIFQKLMDGFGKACEEEGVEIAIAIAKHPISEQPMVFFRAPHIVEAGSLMAGVLREIKADITASLDTESNQ